MDLIQEYERQQKWRDWERYLNHIPISHDDSVLDLGCSLGFVSRVLSARVKSVLGIDINQEFIDYCNSHKSVNEAYICADIASFSDQPLPAISGVWGSFTLSYLGNPQELLVYLISFINRGGWVALLDVSCFISGNLAKNSKYYDKVRTFELESYRAGIYDFNFGAKLQVMLENAGFEIAYFDNDVDDPELNFSGSAPQEVIDAWSVRLARMRRLQNELGSSYGEFCSELLTGLRSEAHEKRGSVRFAVARNV